jgi:hypothetical protein
MQMHTENTPRNTFLIYLGNMEIYCILKTCCIIFDIFVNYNWVVTRWQQYSTHLHTNITQNDTKQQYIEQNNNFGRMQAVPRLG